MSTGSFSGNTKTQKHTFPAQKFLKSTQPHPQAQNASFAHRINKYKMHTRCAWAGGTFLHFLQIFLLNPNFLLAHGNRYLEGMDNGQKNPTDTLILIPTFKIYVFSYSRRTDRQTDGWIDREINPVWAWYPIGSSRHTRCAWAGGTFSQLS
jgi:hypothetical protein